MPRIWVLAPSLFLALQGCSKEATPDAAVVIDAALAEDAGTDAGVPEDAGEADSGVIRPPDICDELGLTRQAFQPGAATFEFGDWAGDFTVTELDGHTWSLAERWTGCESFVFLAFLPTAGSFEEQLFESPVEPLLMDTPMNAHFFFLSQERSEDDRRLRLETLRARLEDAIERLFDGELADAHRARFHFVAEQGTTIPGSVGAFLTDYLAYAQTPGSRVDLGDRGVAPPPLPYAFAIDRDQRWDPAGNLSRFVGAGPAFAMAGYLPHFFDHKARIRDAQAAETGVTRVSLLDETTTGRVFVRRGQLPAASAMASFDTLEFDVRVVCHHRNVFGCSEWDRNAYIELCEDEGCQAPREVVRWITPYWRRGEQRWVMDASALLGLVRGGGAQWFRIILGPEWERPTEWEVQVVLRLRAQGAELRSVGVERAFVGGNFDASYNDREPFTFTPPASARRVELVVIVSGHGQAERTNCAEWCDHRHRFVVNGRMLDEIRHRGRISSADGCGPAAARGVPPGQWGNWAPERAYWCPGMPVDAMRFDITSQVTLGEPNQLSYSANLAGGAPGGGNIDLSAYVVTFE